MGRIATAIYRHTPTPILRGYRRIRRIFRESEHPTLQRVDSAYEHISQGYRRQMGMNFVSLAEMAVLVDEWVQRIDRDFDVVVGVPRSGLLVASMVATKLGKPLATPERPYEPWVSKHADRPEPKRFLLIDDSVGSGRMLEHAREQMKEAGVPHESIRTGALVVCKDTERLVDTYATSVEFPRFFEWNMMHMKQDVVADMDGVLCEEPTADDTRNDGAYEKWLTNARPYLIPTFEIPVILTSRIERYRPETEEWLRENGVQYKELVMSQCESRQEQRAAGDMFKVEFLKRRKPTVYWESSYQKARTIAKETGVPVLAVDRMQLVN